MYFQKCNSTALFPISPSWICELFIYSHVIGPSILQGLAVSFLGIFVSNFRYSVFAVWGHWIRIQEGENDPEKLEKVKKI